MGGEWTRKGTRTKPPPRERWHTAAWDRRERVPDGSESAGCGPHAADAPLPGEAPRRPGLQRESGFVSTCWRVNEPHAHASMTRGRFALRRHARSHTSRSRFGFLFFNLTRLFYSRVSFLQEKTQGQERRPQWRRTMAREMSLWWPEPPREEDLPRSLPRASHPARKPGPSHTEKAVPHQEERKEGTAHRGTLLFGKTLVSREGLTLGKSPVAIP